MDTAMENIDKRDIAIIGFSCRFPDAKDYQEFYLNLRTGKDSVRSLSEDRMKKTGGLKNYQHGGYLDNIDLFDHEFFNISYGEAINMAPEQRILMEVVYEAINDSGYSPDKFNNSRTSLYVSDTHLDYYTLAKEFDPTLYTGNINAILAGRISRYFNFRGTSLMVDTACSSSLVAVHLACNDLIIGDSDYAIACGCKLALFPLEKEDVIDIGISSKTGKARAFSDDADGTIGGEGFGCILLKPLEKAIEDKDFIHAIIKGTAVNQDGKLSGSLTAPDSIAQSEVIKECWSKANISPEEIGYIETHGTGTKLGDPIEVAGLNKAFEAYTKRKNFCAISSVKTNIGHTDSTAGMASLIKAILSIKNKELFPSLHFSKPNFLINFKESALFVNNTLQKWESEQPRIAGVSSFGLIGTNCHVVLKEAVRLKKEHSTNPGNRLLVISAKNKESLNSNIESLAAHLEQLQNKNSLDDISYTLLNGREHFNYRFAIMASGIPELISSLRDNNNDNKSLLYSNNIKTFFVFSGDTVTDKTIVLKLKENPIYKTYYDQCCSVAGFIQDNPSCIRFACQYAFFKTLQEFGADCRFLIGDGTGKITIAVIKGEMSFTAAIEALLHFKEINSQPTEERVKNLLSREDNNNVLFVEVGPEGNISRSLKRKQSEKIQTIVLEDEEDVILTFIKKLYLGGNKINWDQFGEKFPGNKIPLPAYKFKPVSCWLSQINDLSGESEFSNNILYNLQWTETALPTIVSQQKKNTFLVFKGECNLSDNLILEIKNSGNKCIKIDNGVNYLRINDNNYTIDILNEDHYRQLFSDITTNGSEPDTIIHTINYNPGSFKNGSYHENFKGSVSQFLLIKRLSLLTQDKKINVVFVTSNASRVLPEDHFVNPVCKMSEGILNAVKAENRKFNLHCIDINILKDSEKESAKLILKEIDSQQTIKFCAYRNNRRYVKILRQVKTQHDVPARIKAGGTYLVTGGAKGIGYEISKYITSKVSCRLIILGRSNENDSSQVELRNNLDRLRSNGSSIHYYEVDVSNKKKMVEIFDKINMYCNKLNGIIHSAGVPGERIPARDLTLPDFFKVLDPKVKGTLYLDELSSGLRPDFFVFFSTLNTYISQKNTIAYTAANTFLDAYPDFKKDSSTQYITINWPGWKKNDEQAVAIFNTDSDSLKPLSNQKGISAFEKIISSSLNNVAVIDANLDLIAGNDYFLIEEKNIEKENLKDDKDTGIVGVSTREKLREIWLRVLKAKTVGYDEDFFDLGGHSLNGSQIINRIRSVFGIEFEFDHILDYPTINTMADYLDGLGSVSEDHLSSQIKQADIREHYELSHSQMRFWILNSISDPAIYNAPSAYNLTGDVKPDQLQQAIKLLVERHESLRTIFIMIEGQPKQKIMRLMDVNTKMSYIELPDQTSDTRLKAMIQEEISKPFNIETEIPLRVKLFKVRQKEYIFVITLHHIVTDDVSTDVIINDLLLFYESIAEQKQLILKELKIQYKDYTEWHNQLLNHPSAEKHKTYWIDQFKGHIPVLEMSTVYPRAEIQTSRGKIIKKQIEENLEKDLRAFSKSKDVTLFMSMMASFNALLYCYSGKTDIVIGTPIAGREHSMLENQVGLYINFLPLRTRFASTDTILNLLSSFRDVALRGFEHQMYPFDKLVNDLKLKLKPGHNYLYDIGFTFHIDEEASVSGKLINGIKVEPIELDSNLVKTDIWMNILDRRDSIELVIEYNTDLFNHEFMDTFAEVYKLILRTMVLNGNTTLDNLRADSTREMFELKNKYLSVMKEKKKNNWKSFKTDL
jgi:acyl transferase domain-containing protein/acyl carrier protein